MEDEEYDQQAMFNSRMRKSVSGNWKSKSMGEDLKDIKKEWFIYG